MSIPSGRVKRFLFVDDDAGFLTVIEQLFRELSRGSWEVLTAENHARALALLREHRIDVVVLDIGMPVMDGLEFLRLLHRTHPALQVVMLTGLAAEQSRKASLEGGAALFLEKPASAAGYHAIFAALDALADAAPQEGFRGVMRRVGLQEVLQMECLGRKSSVLEVFTGNARGRIFIRDGDIVHAETGSLQGEVALYSLLRVRGGEFNLLPFTPPRTAPSPAIRVPLMEAARLSDEQSGEAPPPHPLKAIPEEPVGREQDLLAEEADSRPANLVRIEEMVLCSGTGEVLDEWKCEALDQRLQFLDQLREQTCRSAACCRSAALTDSKSCCRGAASSATSKSTGASFCAPRSPPTLQADERVAPVFLRAMSDASRRGRQRRAFE
jgi:CheY-like chemotaxis protein